MENHCVFVWLLFEMTSGGVCGCADVLLSVWFELGNGNVCGGMAGGEEEN